MKGIIDFHTHAFPDDLSERVIKMLEDEGGIKAHLDGKDFLPAFFHGQLWD